MNWQQLLSDARWGSRHQSTASPQKNRSNYDRDYGRILFSSAFRRLQDKTQVFPLGRNDYDGSEKKFFPDDYVTIIGSGTLGNTWYGVTPEERTLLGDPKVDVSVLDSGIAIAVQTIYGPPVQYSTTASQIVLPSYEGMDSVFVIKVK